MKIRTIHLLGLLGGIINTILGIIILIVGSRAIMIEQVGRLGIYYGIWTLAIGILFLIGATMLPKERGSRVGALFLVIFGLLGAIAGMLLYSAGPILALIAGIAALNKRR
jgi:hypothetical protein